MKNFFLPIFIFLAILNANAKTGYKIEYYRNSSGNLQPIVRTYEIKKEIKGVGSVFQSTVEITNGKVQAYVRDCGWVLIGDLNKTDASGQKIKNEKLEKLKNGDRIELKMENFGSCSVAGWDFF